MPVWWMGMTSPLHAQIVRSRGIDAIALVWFCHVNQLFSFILILTNLMH